MGDHPPGNSKDRDESELETRIVQFPPFGDGWTLVHKAKVGPFDSGSPSEKWSLVKWERSYWGKVSTVFPIWSMFADRTWHGD
jgi:hypothetical protein